MKAYTLVAALGLALAAGGTPAGAQEAAQPDGRQGGGRRGGGPPAPVPPPVRNAQGVLIETPPPGNIPNGGTYQSKVDTAPASSAMAAATMKLTPRHGEWVDIPVGKVRLHTWISYPDGNGRVPVVLVLSDEAGMWDDFPRGIADQLAQDGFIGVVPDFVSGMGPKGGNWDSFESLNLAVMAAQKLSINDALDLSKGARDYALKLPRANGKSATLGFSFGGDVSFAAAALIPGLSAAIIFDGNTAPDAATMAKITAPVLYFGGDLNDRDVALVASASPAMEKLGKSFEYHIWAITTGQFVQIGQPANDTQANLASWPIAKKFLQDHTM
jgi:carboxymethylenebutenolidase